MVSKWWVRVGEHVWAAVEATTKEEAAAKTDPADWFDVGTSSKRLNLADTVLLERYERTKA